MVHKSIFNSALDQTGSKKINDDARISKNSSMLRWLLWPEDEEGNFLGASALVLEGLTRK
jgi:hypothetical protein